MTGTYYRKPVEVEALQHTGDIALLMDTDWTRQAIDGGRLVVEYHSDGGQTVYIKKSHTNYEFKLSVRPGDYIIHKGFGELEVLTEKRFEQEYGVLKLEELGFTPDALLRVNVELEAIRRILYYQMLKATADDRLRANEINLRIGVIRHQLGLAPMENSEDFD